MSKRDQSCGLSRDDKHAIQDSEIKMTLKNIRNKILVLSGKGGVGKSSIAAYLSASLANKGHKVGLMDVDLHGPSIPRMLGLRGSIQPGSREGKAIPVSLWPNFHVISIESLMGENKDAATIWRGPLKIGVIRQFISDIQWSDLDYLIIDSPPGTGDEPLTVAQTIPDAKALIVTTPQEVSLADVRKSINFCRQVKMEILGLVENMSGLKCPYCRKTIDLFKSDGGRIMAKKEGLRLLASLPLEPEIVRKGDSGLLSHMAEDWLPYTQEFKKMVTLIEELSENGENKEVEINGNKLLIAIPTAGGKLCPHFGHCEQFALIETENGKIKGISMQTPPAHEPGVLPKWLHEHGTGVIIAGGMGASAQQLFDQNGIKVITGAPLDSPESLVHQYLSDNLVTGDNACDH